MEVPTILYFLKQRIPEQIDDNPVPHGGRGASGGLQGFLPGHSSLKRTANKIADLSAPRSGVASSRFSPRTEFNCDFFFVFGTHF